MHKGLHLLMGLLDSSSECRHPLVQCNIAREVRQPTVHANRLGLLHAVCALSLGRLSLCSDTQRIPCRHTGQWLPPAVLVPISALALVMVSLLDCKPEFPPFVTGLCSAEDLQLRLGG